MCTQYNPAADCVAYRDLENLLARSKGVKKKDDIQKRLDALKARMRRFGSDVRGNTLLVSA